MKSLTLYQNRNALRIALSIVIAFIGQFYFSQSKEVWIVLTVFILSQATMGTVLRQEITLTLLLVIIILFSTAVQLLIKPFDMIVLGSIFFIVALFVPNLELPNQKKSILLLIPFILVFVVFLSSTLSVSMHARIIDILMGAVLGILFNQFILPTRLGDEFARGILPVLQSMVTYTDTFNEALSENKSILVARKQLEVDFVTAANSYPEWVYDIGLNPALRRGFRFFLLHLEHAGELFISLQFQMSRSDGLANSNVLLLENKNKKISELIIASMTTNKYLLDLLIGYFNTNKIAKLDLNLTQDILALELALQHIFPQNLELLDISPDYVALTACVRDIKDLRQELLKLVSSLTNDSISQ